MEEGGWGEMSVTDDLNCGLTMYCVMRIKRMSKEKGISFEDASRIVTKELIAFLEAIKKKEADRK